MGMRGKRGKFLIPGAICEGRIVKDENAMGLTILSLEARNSIFRFK